LSNGDSLEGKLLQLDSKEIVLETSFAGKMIFPRNLVKMLEPLPPEREPIFSGPTGLDGWTLGKVSAVAAGESGQWSYTNGAFYATRAASIARDVKLPDVARIEFDLAWKGVLQSAIALYTSYMQPVNLQTKDTDPDFGAFYSLQINSFVSTLMPVRKNEPLKYMGQIPVPAFSQKNHAHVEILASKPKRSIAFFVDGSLVKEWVDTEEFAGSGTGMRFVHQGQGAVKLSHLRIAEWNGKMESKATNLPPFKDDLTKLLNGDKVSGTLETFRDGKLSFSTANGKLDIPFERVAEAFFKSKETTSANRANVRAFFTDGGSVTFQLERWDGQGVVATSPNFGRATFAPGTFERAQLNLESTNQPTDETSKKNRFE
jgi:catechol 2,3-dioxygenase-like lactoylglutathione lyase family enzyme